MYLRLKIQFDANEKCRVLQLSLVINSAFDDIPSWSVQIRRGWNRADVARDLPAARGLAIAVGIRVVTRWAHSGLAGLG